MIYKNAADLYIENIKDKDLYIPRLSYLDELNFNMLNQEINRLSKILNSYSGLRQFLMFNSRSEYKALVNELLEFYKFWSFSIYKEIKIQRVQTKEWN